MSNKIEAGEFNIDHVDLGDPEKVEAVIRNSLDVLTVATAKHKELSENNQRQQKVIESLRAKVDALTEQLRRTPPPKPISNDMEEIKGRLRHIETILSELMDRDPVQIIVGGLRQRDDKGRFIKKGKERCGNSDASK